MRPGYKQTEVGVIPEDWDVVSLSDLGKLERGKFSARPRNDPKFFGGNIPFIQTGDVSRSNGRNVDYSQTLNEEGLKVSKLFPANTLYFTIAANIGDLAIVTFKAACPDSLITIAPRPNINKEWLYQTLRDKKAEFEIIATSNAQLNINLEKLNPYKLAVPPKYEEQQSIAKALSDVDELIVSLEKLIAKKRDIKTATMQQLLTGKKRLPGFGEGKGYKQTELGEIPEDWELKKLGEFLKYEQPTMYLVTNTEYSENGEIPVLTAGKTFILGYTHEEHGIFDSLPVIIFDDFTTATKFVDFRFKAKSSAMKMLLPRTKDVSLHYIFSLMQMIDFPLGDHKRHWIGEYQYLDIAVPSSSDEQVANSKALSDMNSEIGLLDRKLNKTKQLKQGMMQELLTGRTRLVDASKLLLEASSV